MKRFFKYGRRGLPLLLSLLIMISSMGILNIWVWAQTSDTVVNISDCGSQSDAAQKIGSFTNLTLEDSTLRIPYNVAAYSMADNGVRAYFITKSLSSGSTMTVTTKAFEAFLDCLKDITSSEYELTFFASSNLSDWTEISSQCKIDGYDSGSGIWKSVFNTYTLTVPEGCRYIKVLYPQTRNYANDFVTYYNENQARLDSLGFSLGNFSGNPGHFVMGVSKVSFTEQPVEFPAYSDTTDFDTVIDCMSMTSGTQAENSAAFSDITNKMEVNSTKDFLTFGDTTVNDGAVNRPLISLTFNSTYYGQITENNRANMIYNVKGNSIFYLESFRHQNISKVQNALDSDFRLKFYVSDDRLNWAEISPQYGLDLNITDSLYPVNDYYTLTVPEKGNYIKVEYPNTRSYAAELGGSNPGHTLIGISKIKYTKGTPFVPPVEDFSGYDTVIDFTKETLSSAYAKMYSYSDVFTLDETSTNDFYNQFCKLACIKYNALAFGEVTEDKRAEMVFLVKPESAFSVNALRAADCDTVEQSQGSPFRITLLGSVDGVNWSPLDHNYDKKITIYNGNFNYDEHLSVDKLPVGINFVKILFPQTKSYSSILGNGNVCNWQTALRNIAYSKGDPSQIPDPDEDLKKEYDTIIDYTKIAMGNNDENYAELSKVLDKMEPVSTKDFFTLGDTWLNYGSANHPLIALTYNSLAYGQISEKVPATMVFNVKENTSFYMEDFLRNGTDQIENATGSKFSLKFYGSADRANWTEITPNYQCDPYTADVTYGKCEQYHFTVPVGYKYIKAVFPQTKSYVDELGGGNPGHTNLGVAVIRYNQGTPYQPAAEDFSRYDTVIDFTKQSLEDSYSQMLSYNGVFTMDETTTKDYYNNLCKLFCIQWNAIKFNHVNENSRPYMIYLVKPNSSFVVNGLRSADCDILEKTLGTPFRITLLGSTDGVDWTALDCNYTKKNTIYNGNFDFDEQYLIDRIPDGINYVKVLFPQSRDYSDILGGSNVCNWQIALRNIAYQHGSESQVADPDAALAGTYDTILNCLKMPMGTKDENTAAFSGMLDKMEVVSTKDYFTYGDTSVIYGITRHPLIALTFNSTYYGQISGRNQANMVFNVKGNTPFSIEGFRRNNIATLEKATDSDFRLKFYASPDRSNWHEVTPDYNAQPFSGDVVYSVKDSYSFNVGATDKYVKVVFPNTRSYAEELGNNDPGHTNLAIAAIRYTKGTAYVPPSDNFSAYDTVIDFTKGKLDEIYPLMDSYYDVFTLNETFTNDFYNNKIQLWCIKWEALKYGRVSNLMRPYITFLVKPNSPFTVNSLRNIDCDTVEQKTGKPFRLQLLGSEDGTEWKDIEVSYSKKNTIYNGNFNFDENYTIDKVPDGINFVKVQFPQEKEYSDVLGDGNVCNWQLALRNIAFNAGDYSQLSTKEEEVKTEQPVINEEAPKVEANNVSKTNIFVIIGAAVAVIAVAAVGVTIFLMKKRKSKINV